MSVELDNSEQSSGCCDCFKSQTNPGKKISNRANDIIHLLMVGNGEVGKSTIIKQMKNLAYSNNEKYAMYDEEWRKEIRPFNENERRQTTLLIHQNIMRIVGTLIIKAQEYKYEFESNQNRMKADELLSIIGDVDTIHNRNVHVTSYLADIIKVLFVDPAIRKAYERRCEYLLSDSTSYFLDSQKLTAVSAQDYIPTADDILRARDPTQGANDYHFMIEGNRFSVTDLGGQPVERQRLGQRITDWLNRCENTGSRKNFILYVASLADYNQRLVTHPDYTQLDESIKLLTILMGIRQLQETGFILFLNKSDIFHDKISEFKDFQDYFEEYLPSRYTGKKEVRSEAKYRAIAEECVAKKFHDAILGTIRRDDALYCRFTNATDKDGMQAIISAVRMDILTDLIRRGNMP